VDRAAGEGHESAGARELKAITVVPGRVGSAQLSDLPEPERPDGALLVEMRWLGICGTDGEIVSGGYGWAPDGAERLVLGHESLGRVIEAPEGGEFSAGDLVAGVVRRPDPVPCACCAKGEWDMCRNGLYTERGIKQRDGYGAERVTLEPGFAVRLDPALGKLGVLTEPTSVVAKAWEQIDRIAERACSDHRTVLVTGAGPVGLLASLLAVQRGFEVHVLDRVEDGPKPDLVRRLGATYHTSSIAEACGEAGPEVIVEATGVGQLVLDAMTTTAPGAIVCLTGVSTGNRVLNIDAGALNNELVLENDVVFGSVNANLRHFEQAARALGQADRSWLEGLITRTVPLANWEDALKPRDDDVKVVVEMV
jgi:glucose 1-dehydrogenase